MVSGNLDKREMSVYRNFLVEVNNRDEKGRRYESVGKVRVNKGIDKDI